MPTAINDKLISWASDVDPGTIRRPRRPLGFPLWTGTSLSCPTPT